MDGSVFVVMASAVISCHVMSCLVWLLDHLLGGPLRLLGHALLHIVHDDQAKLLPQCNIKSNSYVDMQAKCLELTREAMAGCGGCQRWEESFINRWSMVPSSFQHTLRGARLPAQSIHYLGR